ncbi:MAG TPA: DUF4097 family beta strand repeat-containing protein [Mucilaginibacter sp.]|nr:DUF4097 family beta strand repeat-containing protein [Mucilaginibacter sp.]
MKTTKIISTLTIAIFLSAKLWAQDVGKDQQLVVPLSEPGKPYKLDAHLVDGSITVNGYEGKDVIIEILSNERKKSGEDHGTGMRKLNSGNNADIQADEHNNEVDIHGNAGRAINLLIKVPMTEGSLKFGTVNNGNISGSNLNGDLEVSNVNGAIKLTNISGSVVANTVNGNVIVTFKSIDPKAAMAYSTLNGNVDVTFPASLKANVKLKSDRGDVYTDFDVVTDQHKPEVTRSDGKGMYSLKIEDWVYGKINGGGPQLLMKTTFGNLYIRKTK